MTFAALDAQRQKLGITGHRLVIEAGMRPVNWYRWKRGSQPNAKTLRKLRAALDRLEADPARRRSSAAPAGAKSGGDGPARQAEASPELIKSTYRGFFVAICHHFGAKPQALLDVDPSRTARMDPVWMEAAKIRALAVYCTVIEFDLRLTQIAGVLDITKQAVSVMLRRVEDLRDDPAIDALLTDTSRLLTGKEPAL